MSRPPVLRLLFAFVSIGVLVFDQATKEWITFRMALHSSVPVVPGLINLTLVTNTGALFGMFRDIADPCRTIMFLAVPVVAITLILYFQYRTSARETMTQSGLALILGGAVGNLVDRLRFGHVVDFVDVFVGEYHWPAFNVADSAICVGVSLLFIDLLRQSRRSQTAEAPPGN
jgi:signal peptidase II